MRFVDRASELQELRALESLSRAKRFVVALFGLRRVGKTRLLLEFISSKGVYFFVNRNKTSVDLLNEFGGILREAGILGAREVVASWDDFFEVVMERKIPPIVFDEFQNFSFVEPAVFGIMQKNIDLHEDKPGLIIVSGSLIGLMKNLFMSAKEPLYGRIKKGMKLEPLSLESCFELGAELGMDKGELIKTYLIFGGFPKYFVTMDDFGLKGKTAEEILDSLLWAKGAPLEDEVNGILSQEFGGRSGIYYSILEAIANGNNTISAIAGYLGTTPSSLTRQIKELRDYFELIEFELPYEGKRGIYRIKHPLMWFWFSEIYRNYSDYAVRKPEFMQKVKKNLNTIYGRAFEHVARSFLVQKLEMKEAYRQWGKIRGAKREESTYEIDLLGENEKGAFAFEIKWSTLSFTTALRLLIDLETKTGYVKRLPKNKLKIGLVAKKIENKSKLRRKGYLVFDLDDF